MVTTLCWFSNPVPLTETVMCWMLAERRLRSEMTRLRMSPTAGQPVELTHVVESLPVNDGEMVDPQIGEVFTRNPFRGRGIFAHGLFVRTTVGAHQQELIAPAASPTTGLTGRFCKPAKALSMRSIWAGSLS